MAITWYQSDPPHPLFPNIRPFHRLIGCSRFAHALQAELGHHTQDIPKLKEIERYNVRCRNTLIYLTNQLVQNWPAAFIRTCKNVGLTRYQLMRSKHELPFDLISIVDQDLGEPFFKTNQKEIDLAIKILERRGTAASRKDLERLYNLKISNSHKFTFKNTIKHIPYGQSRYWKLDGIDPSVREAANKAARQAGEKVAVWVEFVLRKELNGSLDE